MNRKKIGFFAIMLGLVLLIIAVISTTLHKNNNQGTTATKNPINYVQDSNKDQFNQPKGDFGTIKLDNLNFQFNYINGATYENAASSLIGSTQHYLLIRNYANVLSYFNRNTGEKHIIDNGVNQAIISPDEQFIIYTKNSIFSETFYYIDLSTKEHKSFYTFNDDNRPQILSLQYRNGLIYFLVKEQTTGKTFVKFTATSGYIKEFSQVDRNSTVNINTDNLSSFDNNIYAFDKSTNALEQIIPSNNPISILNITSEKVQRFISVDFITRDQWAVSLLNDKNQSVIITPQGKITEFKNLMGAYWFDKNYLLVNDNMTLYLYNLQAKNKTVVKSGITSIFPTTSSLVLQTNQGSILALQKK